GSGTTSGCLRPSRAIKAGNSASAPPPTDIRRGIVINAAIAASSLSRLFQAKTQNAAGLFARLDKLAAGRLTEMLEILGGAGIGREDFEDAAGRHGLERAARLQDRERAEQPSRIERRCRFGCRSVTRFRHNLSSQHRTGRLRF